MARKQKKSKSKRPKAHASKKRSMRASRKAARGHAGRARPRGRQQRSILISEIMTPNVEVLRPTDNAAETARKMRDLNVGVIPVCEDSRIVGVITDRDITIRITAEGRDPNTVQLQECLSQELITAEPHWTVDRAAALMAEHQIRRLPVVENGELVGMVSLGDLAAKTQKSQQATHALREISKPAAPRLARPYSL